MVIPVHLVEEVSDECSRMTLFEKFVMEKTQKGQKIIGLYPLTDEKIRIEFEEWKNENSN